MTRLVVVSSGLRDPSTTRLLADRLDDAVRAALANTKTSATSTIVELRPLARLIADMMVTGVPAQRLESVFDTLAAADGLIAVTPAFNASFSGLFKSFFDVLPEGALDDMPVLVAATGGTERHSLVLEHALRPMFSYLHAVVSPTGVYATTGDFGTDDGEGTLADRIDRAARDFARLLTACGRRTPKDPFAEDLGTVERLLQERAARPAPQAR